MTTTLRIRDIAERKQMEEALKESESSLVEAQRVGRIGSWDWNIQTGEVRWSVELYPIYGVDPETYIPTMSSFARYVHPDDREFVNRMINQIVSVVKSVNFDFRIVLADGSTRILNTVGAITSFDENGKPCLMMGIIQDITERQQAEQKLRKLNEKLEMRVAERTHELKRVNRLLHDEMVNSKKSREAFQYLSRRLVQVQEEERRAIARELHDEVGQYLTITKLMLDMVAKSPQEKVAPLLNKATVQVAEALQRVRSLSLDLRPSMLDDLGLVPALIWLFDRLEKQSGLKIDFKHNVTKARISPDADTAIYRIVQEALTNVIRHAQVTSARVRLWSDGETLSLEVEDSGPGFELDKLAAGASTGLSAMRERATLLGGELSIESTAGTGTRVMAEIPIPK